MKHKISILSATILLIAGTATAQYNETNNLFYFAQRTPQSNLLNPAFFPSSNAFYLSLPGVWGQFGVPLAVGDVTHYDAAAGKNIIDINQILNTLTDNSQFRLGLDIPAIGMGLRIGKIFVDFNTMFHINGAVGLPMTMVNTLLDGNVRPDGTAVPEAILLDGSLFNAQAYLEASIGAGYRFSAIPLTVGAHIKLLSGLVNVQTDKTLVTFETDEEFDDVKAKMYYELMAASVLPIDTNRTGLDQVLGPITDDWQSAVKDLFDLSNGNTGIAFDLGAKYELGPLTISASINDLSAGIHWQKNVAGFVPEGGQGTITFSGIEMNDILNNGSLDMDSINTYLSEKFDEMMPKLVLDGDDYWYSIPTKLNLAIDYRFLNLLHAGVLFHGQWDRGLISKTNPTQLDLSGNVQNTFRYNTTLSVGLNLFNWIELIAASSVVYDGQKLSPLNPGLGLIFTPATVLQTYFFVDYASSIHLVDMKAFNIKFGMNILIGRGGKHRVLGF